MLLCGLTKWQRNNCKGMREIQWAQVTVSKQYREHAFRKPPSTTMDGGWIKGNFDPWQRSVFVPSVSSANTKEKGLLLAGNFPFVFQVPAWVVLPSSNDDAFGILQPTWYYDFKISIYCIWRTFERHSYSTKVAFQHKNTQNLPPFLSACLCYCCKVVSWASPGNYPDT